MTSFPKPTGFFAAWLRITPVVRSAKRRKTVERWCIGSGSWLLFSILCCALPAQSTQIWRSGGFGEILGGGGTIEANFIQAELLDSLNVRGHLGNGGSGGVEKGVTMSAGQVGYGFQGTGTKLLLSGGITDPWRVSAVQRMAGGGRFSFSAFYQEMEVWENPYHTGVGRAETEAQSFGYGLAWNDLLNTGIGIFFKRTEIDIGRDQIGVMVPDLRRGGADITLGLGYPWDLGAVGTVNCGVGYVIIDRDGEANSGHGYVLEVSHTVEWERFVFTTGLELIAREFDKTNPVFNEKREKTAFTVSGTVSLAEPFGLTNANFYGVAAYSQTIANTTFSEGNAFILGAGFRFQAP